MLSQVLLPLLLSSLAALVRADPNPTEPGPGEVFKEGQTCHVAWNPDTTGSWKTMNIELMTGSNFAMVHLTTVAVNIDGTTGTGTFDYPCPAVTDHSSIYFYQFTSPSSQTKIWTTRFTIADPTGATNPAPNAIEPDGSAIPWGNGALANPASAVPAPSYLGGSPASGSPPAPSVVPSSTAGSSSASSSAASTASSSAASTPASATSRFVTSTANSAGATPSAGSNNKAAPASSSTNSTGSTDSQSNGAASGASGSSVALAALAVLAGALSALL